MLSYRGCLLFLFINAETHKGGWINHPETAQYLWLQIPGSHLGMALSLVILSHGCTETTPLILRVNVYHLDAGDRVKALPYMIWLIGVDKANGNEPSILFRANDC